MIVGIGHDIIEMERVRKVLVKSNFLARYFTSKETQDLEEVQLAGNFCVKEAVAKALGTGFRGFGPADIEVLRDALGKPVVYLYGGAKERANALGVSEIYASISDLKDLVSAIAVLEKRD